MLLATIRAQFQARIEDSVYWNDTKADTLANQAQRDIAGRLELMFQNRCELICEADLEQYSVPSDYISNYLLRYDNIVDPDTGDLSGDYNQTITMLDGPDEVYGVVGDPSQTGNPTHAFLWAIEDRRDLFLHPIPDDEYVLQWWYQCEPPELVNNNDEPKLPRELHQYIIDFMELRARMLDGDISDMQFMALWEKKIIEIRTSASMKEALRRHTRIPSGKDLFPSTSAWRSDSLINVANDGDFIWRSIG